METAGTENSGLKRKNLDEKPRLGIAFGGGAARGFAHIGIIKVLEEAGITAGCVSGTSVGSLVAALYCDGYSGEALEAIAAEIHWKDLVQFRPGGGGMFITDRMESFIDDKIGRKRFDQLRFPLAVTAVDVVSGEIVVFREGPVARAARISATVPGVFVPLRVDGRLLIDGGMVNVVPGDLTAEMGADIVLGINLNGSRTGGEPPKRVRQVVKRTMNIMVNNNLQLGRPHVDIMVAPDVANFSYNSLRPRMEMIKRGEAAMREALPRLVSLLQNRAAVCPE